MFLNDALQHCGRARVIPDPFGIDHRDGTARTDLEAIGLGARNERLRADETEFLEPVLEVIPRNQTRLPVTALRLGLVGTEKEMPPHGGQAEFGRQSRQLGQRNGFSGHAEKAKGKAPTEKDKSH